MFRRDVYIKSGGYSDAFRYAQDRDLWSRMSFFCKFYIVEDVLVERYHSISDSVSGDYEKSLHQKYLSDFSIFCHRMRLANGFDSVRNTDLVKLLYSPSFSVQKRLFRLSLTLVKRKEYKQYRLYKRNATTGKGYVFNVLYIFLDFLVFIMERQENKVNRLDCD